MTTHNKRSGPWIKWFAVSGLVILFTFLLILPAKADDPDRPPVQETENYCLSCHSNPDLSMTLPSEEKLSLSLSRQMLDQSVHSPLGIECEACHTQIKTYPHPKQDYEDKRAFARAYYLACQKCHATQYDETQDSIHAQAAAAGNLAAPICTDCHSAHDVRPPDQPRAFISETCGQCHAQIYDAYQRSVHGAALLAEDNPDVPVCTTCHGVHNIQDARTAQFRVESPDLCASCHANEELMSRYGLEANVYTLYTLSWHGADISVYKANWPTIWHESAVCTDCHGIHDILSTTDPNSRVNPGRLLETCQKCHPGVGPNWTQAWTGHNEISLERTPLVYYINAFYQSFSPFVLWLAILYVALQIIRATIDRVRRTLS